MKLTNLSKDGRRSVKARLYPKLRHGDLRSIAEETKLSYNYVRNVLDPETTSWNENTIQAAITMINQREEADKALAENKAA